MRFSTLLLSAGAPAAAWGGDVNGVDLHDCEQIDVRQTFQGVFNVEDSLYCGGNPKMMEFSDNSIIRSASPIDTTGLGFFVYPGVHLTFEAPSVHMKRGTVLAANGFPLIDGMGGEVEFRVTDPPHKDLEAHVVDHFGLVVLTGGLRVFTQQGIAFTPDSIVAADFDTYTMTSSYTVVPPRDAATPDTDPGDAGSSPPETSGDNLPSTGDADWMDVTVPLAPVHASAAATAATAATAAAATNAVEGHLDTAAALTSSPGLPYTEDVGGSGGGSLSASPPALAILGDDPAAPIIATAAITDIGGADAGVKESAVADKPGENAEADGDAVENRTVSTPYPHEHQEQPKANSGHGTESNDASSSGSVSSSSGSGSGSGSSSSSSGNDSTNSGSTNSGSTNSGSSSSGSSGSSSNSRSGSGNDSINSGSSSSGSSSSSKDTINSGSSSTSTSTSSTSSTSSSSSSGSGNNKINSGNESSPDSAIDDDATTEAPTLPFRNSWTHKKRPNDNDNDGDDSRNHSDEGNGGGDREQQHGDHSNGDSSSSSDGGGGGFESFFPPELLPHDGPSLRVGEVLTGKLHGVDGPSAVYCSPDDAALVFSTPIEGGETDDGFAPVEVVSTLIHSDQRKVAKARRVRREIAEEDAERERAGGEDGAAAKKGKLETVRGWLPFGKGGFLRRRAREHARKHLGEVGLTITDRGVLEGSMDGTTVLRRGGPSWFGFRKKDPSFELRTTARGIEVTRGGELSWSIAAKEIFD